MDELDSAVERRRDTTAVSQVDSGSGSNSIHDAPPGVLADMSNMTNTLSRRKRPRSQTPSESSQQRHHSPEMRAPAPTRQNGLGGRNDTSGSLPGMSVDSLTDLIANVVKAQLGAQHSGQI